MSNEKDLFANKVVAQMMEQDRFSQWLGIEVRASVPNVQ